MSRCTWVLSIWTILILSCCDQARETNERNSDPVVKLSDYRTKIVSQNIAHVADSLNVLCESNCVLIMFFNSKNCATCARERFADIIEKSTLERRRIVLFIDSLSLEHISVPLESVEIVKMNLKSAQHYGLPLYDLIAYEYIGGEVRILPK